MSKQKKSESGIPIQIVNQLNEHAAGGFILFYFNNDSGAPENLMTFDSPAHSLALQKYIMDWSIALGDMNIESAKYDIEQAVISQEEDDDSSEQT